MERKIVTQTTAADAIEHLMGLHPKGFDLPYHFYSGKRIGPIFKPYLFKPVYFTTEKPPLTCLGRCASHYRYH